MTSPGVAMHRLTPGALLGTGALTQGRGRTRAKYLHYDTTHGQVDALDPLLCDEGFCSFVSDCIVG